ncbi:MAG: cysteine peptidase family C39 domain-containing protein [Spirochaetota bacterium]|jgi:predicted double-glycine peptidase|uniref:Peptidase C39 domain-containing protein n=1 Tax=Gracilinema caldarium TaxID=215591 RepID=A0A7C3EAE0_9SPIR
MAAILSLVLLLQNIQSLETLRFSHVAEQGYDTSCGLSVLSELVSRYWNYPISEETFLREWISTVKEYTTKEQYSISFKDMRDLIAHHGFASKAFRFTYNQLIKAAATYAPIIIHFADQEGHFVLCLSATEDYLVIADPAEGVYWISREDFQKRWQGYALLVQLPGKTKQTETLTSIVQERAENRSVLQ